MCTVLQSLGYTSLVDHYTEGLLHDVHDPLVDLVPHRGPFPLLYVTLSNKEGLSRVMYDDIWYLYRKS